MYEMCNYFYKCSELKLEVHFFQFLVEKECIKY